MHTSWHLALSHLRVDAVDAHPPPRATFHFTSLSPAFASQMSRSAVILPAPTLPSLFQALQIEEDDFRVEMSLVLNIDSVRHEGLTAFL